MYVLLKTSPPAPDPAYGSRQRAENTETCCDAATHMQSAGRAGGRSYDVKLMQKEEVIHGYAWLEIDRATAREAGRTMLCWFGFFCLGSQYQAGAALEVTHADWSCGAQG